MMLINNESGRDNSNEVFQFLRRKFLASKYKFTFGNIFDCVFVKADSFIFLNPSIFWVPFILLTKILGKKNINLALEHEAISYLNGRHFLNNFLFNKVITYRTNNLAENEISVQWPALEPNVEIKNNSAENLIKKKFVCMLAGNKSSYSKGENYQLRRKIWKNIFEKYPSEVSLFGLGWSDFPRNVDYHLSKRIYHFVKFLCLKISGNKFDQFDAEYIPCKTALTNQYRFCIAIENYRSPDGWITEKVFDALKIGSIPVIANSSITGFETFCVSIDTNYSLEHQIENLYNLDNQELRKLRENGIKFLQNCMKNDHFTYNQLFTVVKSIVI